MTQRLPVAVTCAVAGCERDLYARGWCRTHYERVRAHGDPQADRPIREYVRLPAVPVGPAEDPAAYMREYRKRRPDYRVTGTRRTNARQAAAARVAELHPEEFDRFLAEEMFKRGLLSAAERQEQVS